MTVILIPSFQPDARLVHLVRALREADPRRPVLVVDDGSGAAYATLFAEVEASGAALVTHERNRGKGAALKTGFAAAQQRFAGHAVVTADGDGQHTIADIERVAAHLTGPALVLGVRAFTGAVPWRSRAGNRLTSTAFRLATGRALGDTQTGLRGIPASLLPWAASLPGDRFEYEFRMLLRAVSDGLALVEVPIATVYADGNSSSHFRPLADSARIYAPLLRFTASALLAFLVDTAALAVLYALTGWLFASVVMARVISAGANFAANRGIVFPRGRDVPMRTAAARYFSLAGLLLAANFGLLTALTDAGIPLLAAKVLADGSLFAVSFTVQRAVVFAPSSPRASTRDEVALTPRE